MTRRRPRLDLLEAQHGGDAVAAPSVIFIAEAGDEAMAGLFLDGSGASRLACETESAFSARVDETVS